MKVSHLSIISLVVAGCASVNHIPSRELSSEIISESRSQPTGEIERVVEQMDHPLMPDFRNLGDAIAKFWRLEERFPSGMDELQTFADEYRLDIKPKRLNNLRMESMVYGRILITSFNFSSPESPNASAQVEINSINPEMLEVSVEADTAKTKAYLEEVLQVFIDQLNRE